MNRHEQDARASRRIGTDCKSALSGREIIKGSAEDAGKAVGEKVQGN